MDTRLLDEDKIIQICFVTHDAMKSAQWFADFTGKSLPPMTYSADPDKANAQYLGQPVDATCKIMMFNFGNIDLEFLEPGPEKSAWRDLLEEKGPGCHHIALKTRNLTKRNEYLTGKGHTLLQKGEFQSGTGRYAYYDTKSHLGVLLELLEFDKDKEAQ